MATLQQALQAVASDLARFAAKDTFGSLFADVFGGNPGRPAVHQIQNQLLRRDLSQLARVEVINGAQLGAANAAYASASNTIYLSDRFLAGATLAELRATLLEEIGHAIDARVNLSDRPGDEGELFSLLVRGLTPSTSERQRILADDDRRTLTINGRQVAVELAEPVPYQTITISSRSLASEVYQISGSNAVWTTRKGANEQLRFFNGNIISTIANSSYQGFGDFAISGSNVAYIKSDGQDTEVFRWSGGITTQLTTNTSTDYDLIMDGNTIAWKNLGDIYRYNGSSVSRITDNNVEEEDVQISGQIMVWAAFDGNDYEIFLNDGIRTRALTNNSVDDYSPVLGGNRVAWFQWNNNQENLFFYDGRKSRQVTNNVEAANPMISGNNVVYQVNEATGNISLKYYNATTLATTSLSDNISISEKQRVQASDNLVAWVDRKLFPGGADTIKLFDGVNTSTISYNPFSFSYPRQIYDFVLQGNKMLYSDIPQWSGESTVFLYDASSSSPASIKLPGKPSYGLGDGIGLDGDRILWIEDSQSLKLTQSGSKPVLTGSNFNDMLTGDSGNNLLSGGGGADRLTGGGSADKFDYRVLTDSLLGSGWISDMDVITDFDANAGGDKLLVNRARAGFLNAGVVSALTNSAIGAMLSPTSFLPHYAASFQVGSGDALRTYIAINNGAAGFNALTDSLIDVTGVKGTINASHFVTT